MEDLKPHLANNVPWTPLSFLERAATAYSDSPSVVYNDTVYTWSSTHRRCIQLASSLSVAGIGRGSVVSTIAPNIPAMYELQFSVPMSGAVLNNINTRLDPRTVSILLQHCGSVLVFVDVQHATLIRDALSLFPSGHVLPKLVLIEDAGESPPEQETRGIFCCTYEDMIETGDPGFEWVQPKSDWDPLALNYTSGTTAKPKGVVVSHRGAFAITLGSLIDWSVPSQPVYLWTLPIFHVNGWSFPWGMAAVGGTNVCLRKLDAATIFRSIEQHGVTHLCGAPVVLNMLANSSESKKRLVRPVCMLTAGSPPPAAVLSRAESLGFVVSHGYGMTETGGLVVSCAWRNKWNFFPATERARLKARQGVRMLGLAKLDVVDPKTGKSVRRDGNHLGEVVLRGGTIMLGYLKDPESTARCITPDGWLLTGDVGVMHPDGYLEIKDRSKDVIISGGENISSVEVETVLYAHPAVHEAAVVAREDEYWGESPCAFITLKEYSDPKPTEREVMDYCREKLPHYMVPKTVAFRGELPKTSTGKIQKYVLREAARSMGPLRSAPKSSRL